MYRAGCEGNIVTSSYLSILSWIINLDFNQHCIAVKYLNKSKFDSTEHFQGKLILCFVFSFFPTQLVLYTFKSSENLHSFVSQNISQVRYVILSPACKHILFSICCVGKLGVVAEITPANMSSLED